MTTSEAGLWIRRTPKSFPGTSCLDSSANDVYLLKSLPQPDQTPSAISAADNPV